MFVEKVHLSSTYLNIFNLVLHLLRLIWSRRVEKAHTVLYRLNGQHKLNEMTRVWLALGLSIKTVVSGKYNRITELTVAPASNKTSTISLCPSLQVYL